MILKYLVNLLHLTNNGFPKKAGYKIFCSQHVFSGFMRGIKKVPCPELNTVISNNGMLEVRLIANQDPRGLTE